MQSLSELSNEENSEEEYEVEKILKERTIQGKDKKTGRVIKTKEYLVKWVGYNAPTWEPEENLENCQEILKDFLLYQIMKKLQKGKNVKSHSQEKNKKVIEKKRKRSDNSDNDNDDNSDEEKENETSTISNSVPRSVNLNKNVNNNKKKKLSNNDDKEDDIDINIKKEKGGYKSEEEDEDEIGEVEVSDKEQNEIVKNEDEKGKNNVHEGFKIKRIKSMIIPKDKNEGIKFNIMYEKEGKTFIDIFDAKNEEIPSEYLIEYYEKFICDNNKGFQYNEEMVFHD